VSGALAGGTLAAVVLVGLVGGVVLAFSAFVMPALGALPAARAVAAMQSVNRAAVTPLFMGVLFGAAAVCAVLVAAGARGWGEPHAARLVVGGTVYLAGVIAPTIAFHVPRNETLARMEPDAPAAAAAWAAYLRQWTLGNHVRTVAGAAAAAVLADALRVG